MQVDKTTGDIDMTELVNPTKSPSMDAQKEAELAMPNTVYDASGEVVFFNQLAVKIPMDHVSNDAYYGWLDSAKADIGGAVPGGAIAEKSGAREDPPLNTAVYYDTPELSILATGALLRTSCNKITHAFCAFKAPENEHGVRDDHRHVFDGDKKATIQQAPTSSEAVQIVQELLARNDIDHPGLHLQRELGIDPTRLAPVLALASRRFTFFVWLDERDALRCSLDRYETWQLRDPTSDTRIPISEVELAVYPRIAPEVSKDTRVIDLMEYLRDSLSRHFSTSVTHLIKYQRCAEKLGLWTPEKK